jgi:hypothetical protein
MFLVFILCFLFFELIHGARDVGEVISGFKRKGEQKRIYGPLREVLKFLKRCVEKIPNAALLLFAPLVLLPHLSLLLWCEVVLDVKRLANLLGGFALDHVGDCFTREVEQGLDVEVVCSENEFEQSGLVNFAEILIPNRDIVSSFVVLLLIARHTWIVHVMPTVLDHLLQNLASDVWQRHHSVSFLTDV